MIALHITIWLIRVFGSYLDGRAGRGTMPWMLRAFGRIEYRLFKFGAPFWLLRILNSFHFANWLRRDVPIIILYWIIYGAPWHQPLIWLFWMACHLVAHRWVFYPLGEKLRNFKIVIERIG